MTIENVNELISKSYISEDNYEKNIKSIVEPYLEPIRKKGTFKGIDDIEIYYEKYLIENSKGSIVISHGYSEYIEKYYELIYTYLKRGYNVFIMEHRCHGRSGNLGVVDKSQVTITRFDDYVSDFKTFMNEVVIPNNKGFKIFLFAHSMGCAIATKFLEENSKYFNAAILSSPMFKINSGSTPYFIAKAISNVAVFLGFGDKYVLGQHKYISVHNIESSGTSSKERYDFIYDRIDSSKGLQRGGVSFRWLKECAKATESILKEENIRKIDIPVLVFQATNDTFVKKEGQNRFKKYSKTCILEVIENAKHDIYTEKDKIVFPYLDKIFNFYEENL